MNTIGISEAGFMVVIWIFTATAAILTAGRLVIRHFILHKLFWDDAFQFFACVLLLSSTILYSFLLPVLYKYAAVTAGTIHLPPDERIALANKFHLYGFTTSMLFWATVYAVKFSFLFLYRLILEGSSASLKAWWAVLAVVLISNAVSMGTDYIGCGPASHWNSASCESSANLALGHKMVYLSFALNLISDLMIMVLPVPTLWGLNMHISRKFAVMGIFLIAWIIVAFDILRVVKSLAHSGQFLALLYAALEAELAVIVSALPAYRALFSRLAGENFKDAILNKKSANADSTSLGFALRHQRSNHSEGADTKKGLRTKTSSIEEIPPTPEVWPVDPRQTV